MLEAETSGHLFWSCPRAKRAWSCFGLLNDSASSESNVEGEEATIPTASSQSKTVSCSEMAKHKTRLKSNGVVSH